MQPWFLDRARLGYRRFRVASNLHRNDALGALHRAWGYVHATMLAGDYYEFGVYWGDSLIHSWFSQNYFRNRLERASGLPFRREGTVARFLEHRPTFHGFDTFAGMPNNREGEDSLAPGSFKSEFDGVRRRCAGIGLRSPTIRLIQGLFADTRDQVGPAPAAIVHLDCDLYASARDALDAIAPCLRQGTIMLCDDYNLFQAARDRGERRALCEFQQRTGIEMEPWFAYGPASQAFICHRAQAPE